jgi:thioester reductase-like protein
MSRVHLITGATGFVGGALVAELLQRTSDEIVVLVRGGELTPQARFRASFADAVSAYALPPAVLDEADRRCRVVAGDITQADCGVQEDLGTVDQLWHCAASLNFENRYLDEIRRSNVDGTRHVLALAQRLRVPVFNHVSTAAVAGERTGLIRENFADDVETNNHYERSKFDAERLVAAVPDMQVRVFRPPGVMGHSQTCAATGFFGFHGLLRNLVQFRGMMERVHKGLLERTPLALVVEPEIEVNLIPVDSVLRDAVTVALSNDAHGVYHLTHPTPPKAGAVIRTMFSILDLHEPRFVSSRDELSWIDSKFDERIEFYSAWLVGVRSFERRRTDAALGAAKRAEPVLDDATIQAHGRWYVDLLEGERTRLPVGR